MIYSIYIFNIIYFISLLIYSNDILKMEKKKEEQKEVCLLGRPGNTLKWE